MTARGRKIIGCEINQASPALRMEIPRGPGTIPETDKKQQAGKACCFFESAVLFF